MSIDLGPKLGLIINGNEGDPCFNQIRPFFRFIDALAMGSVLNASTTVPPVSPSNGDAYLLLGVPTGAWSGQANVIAVWSTEITLADSNTKVPGWDFWTPNNGWSIYDTSLAAQWYFIAGAWTQRGASPGLITVASSATPTFDFSQGKTQKMVLTSSATVAFTGATPGDRCTLILEQGGSGGYSVTWGGNIRGLATTPGTDWPTINTNGIFEFIYDGTNYLCPVSPNVGI